MLGDTDLENKTCLYIHMEGDLLLLNKIQNITGSLPCLHIVIASAYHKLQNYPIDVAYHISTTS